MRYSHQRDLILNLLKNCKDHPTADVIYERAREKEPNISLGTVYRNLKQLSEAGEIITLETEDNKLHYDGDVTGHQHFVCKACNRIIDLFYEPEIPIELIEMGLTVDNAKCVYYGNCNNCKKN